MKKFRSGIWDECTEILEIADYLECRGCRGWPCGLCLLRMLPSRGGLQLQGHNLPHAVPVSMLFSTYLDKSSGVQVEGNVPHFLICHALKCVYCTSGSGWYITGCEQWCPSSCRYFIFSTTSCLCYGGVRMLAARWWDTKISALSIIAKSWLLRRTLAARWWDTCEGHPSHAPSVH